MNNYIRFILLIFLITFVLNVFAEGNPFLKSNSANTSTKSPERNESQIRNKTFFTLLGKYHRKLNKLQNKINKNLTRIANQIKSKPSFKQFVLAFVLAFCYGFIHALGPGHGKIFALSFLITRKSRTVDGVILGIGIALLHVLSAVVLTLSIYFILKTSVLSMTNNFEVALKQISYILITLIGLGIFFFHLKNIINKNKKIEFIEYSSSKSLIPIAVSIGIVPCPCITIVLLFCISLNMLFFGLFLVFSITTGMAVVISMFGLLAIKLKNRSYNIFKGQIRDKKIFENILGITGASLIIMIGSLLFFASFI